MHLSSRKEIVKFGPRLPGVLVILILGACATVGPDYVPPETSTSAAWHTSLAGGLTAEKMDPENIAAWWTTLNDRVLSELIEQAIRGNLELREARARVRQARAQRGISKAELFPTLDATGAATTRRSSENSGSGRETGLYTAGFDAGWELDVFGGIRRSVEAAGAELEASRADLRDVLVSLVAEVALNYVEARTYQARLAVAQANLEAQEGTYQLTRWQYEAGLSDELVVQQATYNVEDTRSQIPSLRTGLEEAKNRLAVLLGEEPGAVHERLAESGPIPVTALEVAVGVPAEALRRRPDVRRAERNLAAQTARVGVATAELYPRFNLLGSIGLESLSTGNLLTAGSRTWSFGPSVSWNVFDAGSIRRNIEVQSALQEQALIQYESTILGALEEVENALVAYAREQERRQFLKEATQAARRAAKLAEDKYQSGLADFTDVLDAQRSLLSFQDQLTQSEGAVTSELITLYKALGGGWKSSVPHQQ